MKIYHILRKLFSLKNVTKFFFCIINPYDLQILKYNINELVKLDFELNISKESVYITCFIFI